MQNIGIQLDSFSTANKMAPLAATGKPPVKDPKEALEAALRSVLDDVSAVDARRENMRRLREVVSGSEEDGGGSRLSMVRLVKEAIL